MRAKEEIERYYIEKYNKEYQCNYQIEEFTYDWNTVGKKDRYRCPECDYIGKQSLCSCEEGY